MTGCRHQRQCILRAADHEITLEERLSLDAHLAHCTQCRSYNAQLLGLEEAVERFPEPPVERLDVRRERASILAAIDASPAIESSPALPETSGRGRRATARSLWSNLGMRWQFAVGVASTGLLFIALFTAREVSPTPIQQVVMQPEVRSDVAEAVTAGAQMPEDPDPVQRVGEVQQWLQQALLSALAAVDTEGTPELDVDAFLEHFDAAAGMERLRWPLDRMAEGFLNAKDPQLARTAARFLGRRGDRISATHLGMALGHPRAAGQVQQVARACVLALGDLGVRGALGMEALETVLDDPELSQWMELALAQLARIGTTEAAESIGRSLARLSEEGARETDDRVQAHLSALARVGPRAVPVYLALADEGHLERGIALAWLGALPGAGAQLVRSLRSERLRSSPAGVQLLLDAAARVQPAEALPWIEELVADYEHRGRALACLESWDGSAPVAALMRIAAQGSVSGDELVVSLRTLAASDGARLSEYAGALLSNGDALGAGRFLEMLIESAHPSSALALAEIAVADLLTGDDRVWAALAIGDLARAAGGRNAGAEAAELLVRATGSLEFRERRLMAACLMAIHEHLGNAGVRAALHEFPAQNVEPVCRALDTAGDSGSASLDLQDTTRVFRIARVLGNSLLSRNSLVATSSL